MKKKMIYDFHTHIKDIEILSNYYESDIIPVVNCQSKQEYEVLEKYYGNLKYNNTLKEGKMFHSMGIHPHDAEVTNEQFGDFYEELIQDANLVGEIGMDGCWCNVTISCQEEAFKYSLDLAKKYNKPVILHTKYMEKKILDIIQDYDLQFIIHWYSCPNYIQDYIKKGCYFTIGPAVLVDGDVQKLVKSAPLDHLLIETDGIEAVEWIFKRRIDASRLRTILEVVIEEIALIKGISKELVEEQIIKNSERILL